MLHRLVLFMTLFFTTGLAEARTFNVLQQTNDVFVGSDGLGGSITGTMTLPYDGRQRTFSVGAGAFELTAQESGSSLITEFTAFCVEISSGLDTSATRGTTYTTDPDMFDPYRSALVATLFQEVYDPQASAMHQGAFQLALWKLTHGDVSSSSGDGFSITSTSSLGFGELSFTRKADGRHIRNTFDANTPGVFSLAQGWLDMLDGLGTDWSLQGTVSDHVTFLHTDDSQDLVTAAFRSGGSSSPPVSAIPVPPALAGLGSALVLLAFWSHRPRSG